MIDAMEAFATKEAAAPPATENQLRDDSSRKDSEGNPKSPDVPILENSTFGVQTDRSGGGVVQGHTEPPDGEERGRCG